jgi:hypothetical protein
LYELFLGEIDSVEIFGSSINFFFSIRLCVGSAARADC